MPLIELLENSPEAVLRYSIKQIVSMAGDGVLGDGSECSSELRRYLRIIPTGKLFEYADYCLENSFENGGFALQDVVNELGRRLDYEVTDGFYHGRINRIGYDGIWSTPNGKAIVLEIKTTDAYRVNLDSVANYRKKLIEAGSITEDSSILIVVGRTDTGDLEAQIRGSRHAWKIRIISLDALVKLVELKTNSDDDATVEKIRSLIIPFEYTRLDNIIDVVFTTTKDVEQGIDEEERPIEKTKSDEATHAQEHTPRAIVDLVRANSLEALSKREGVRLIAHKRTQYWSADRTVRAVSVVSKRYDTGYYWYGFHPDQQKFLEAVDRGYLLLGCVDHDVTYALSNDTVTEILPYLNRTENEDRMFWHIHLQPREDGTYQLLLPRKGSKGDKLLVAPYSLPVPH